MPDDFYSSKYFIDKTIEFVASNEDSDQPFFAYIPFQAVHIPVQAPKEYSDKYAGVYDEGWSVMREKRRQTAVALGVIPKESEIKVTPGTVDWSSMTDEQRRYDARRMEVYAGMVDAMDFHIGRLMDYLKSIDEYENTVFIFTSDNGAASSPLLDSDGNSVLKNWFDRVGYNTDYESLGEKGSWVSIGPGNASIANSPLLYYKFHANEGGLRVPLIMSGPGITRHGEITDEFTFVTDLAPTILNLTGTTEHRGKFNGREVEPIVGVSFTDYLNGAADQIHQPSESIGYELGGSNALFKGDYKIVINKIEQNETNWHLYNIKTDPGETTDLINEKPQLFAEMLSEYESWAEENNVLPMPQGYNRGRAIFRNGFN